MKTVFEFSQKALATDGHNRNSNSGYMLREDIHMLETDAATSLGSADPTTRLTKKIFFYWLLGSNKKHFN